MIGRRYGKIRRRCFCGRHTGRQYCGCCCGRVARARAGRETRQILRKSADALPELAEDLSTTLQLQADRLSESALSSWESTLVRLREAVAAGVDASQMKAQQLAQRGDREVNPVSANAPDHRR